MNIKTSSRFKSTLEPTEIVVAEVEIDENTEVWFHLSIENFNTGSKWTDVVSPRTLKACLVNWKEFEK
jgi:hypothetical protein